ncbi:tRNA guanosine(34) transglycosylase Tgt [Candidatus Micrarchaeota archaeon]|nr:tRNA guanosine(34) transglycosylase Tgt [Candidatus Micrarchaeota archaeon]MBU1931055.1 tRNA guanosine(34) transglycosylase Tgt [Candidatus Micrarchaeota archaeon]
MKTAFKIQSTHGTARTGILKTDHGKIKTPFFMPVATKGSVKYASMQELEKMGIECFISNAFLLSIRPGLEIIKKFGGLHSFVNWKKGIFTDSGGFQILNQDFLIKIVEEGVHFKNPFDKQKEFLSPEKSIQIQNALGSDVAMCLDDVPLHGSPIARLQESQERTTRWAERCIKSHKNKKQLLFGINQGGTHAKLREKSAQEIGKMDFDGFAFGGLCIGEEKKQMQKMIELSAKHFSPEKPRYLMGVGSLQEIAQSILAGADVFDSAFPTRTARHGMAFSIPKNLNLKNAVFRNDSKPLDEQCDCMVCQSYSRAYIHHLIRTKEENGLQFLTHHNLFFLADWMQKIRTAIQENQFKKLCKWQDYPSGEM